MRCIICDSPQAHVAEDLHICRRCGLVSSSLQADTSLYGRDYCQKYQCYGTTDLGHRIVAQRAALVHHYLGGGTLLDFGCGSGRFIYEMLALGFEAVGFDINQFSGFCSVERLFDAYDAITAWDSVEHLNNPLAPLRGIRAKYLFLCTPNRDNCKNILSWRHYRPREHIHYFNEASLRALLDAAGYRTIEVTFEESDLRIDGERNIITIVGQKKERSPQNGRCSERRTV